MANTCDRHGCFAVQLNEAEAQIAVHALRVAAERFDADAAVARESGKYERLAQQFDKQAAESRKLADDIES